MKSGGTRHFKSTLDRIDWISLRNPAWELSGAPANVREGADVKDRIGPNVVSTQLFYCALQVTGLPVNLCGILETLEWMTYNQTNHGRVPFTFAESSSSKSSLGKEFLAEAPWLTSLDILDHTIACLNSEKPQRQLRGAACAEKASADVPGKAWRGQPADFVVSLRRITKGLRQDSLGLVLPQKTSDRPFCLSCISVRGDKSAKGSLKRCYWHPNHQCEMPFAIGVLLTSALMAVCCGL